MLVETSAGADQADVTLDLFGLAGGVIASEGGGARRGREQTQQDAESGGFACSIGTKQRKNFTGANRDRTRPAPPRLRLQAPESAGRARQP